MPGSLPSIPLAPDPTPVEELHRLRESIGAGPRLLIKRDDTIGFAFGGNKVRKMRLVAADALARSADTLITAGGLQSNHARVTAAAAAHLGLGCVLVVNGRPPERLTANALLDHLLGAEVRYVADRGERTTAMEAVAGELRRQGRHPYVIPIGASTPLGAAAFVDAIAELGRQIEPPDLIVHSTSSGGTQAGLLAGCALAGWPTRVIGVSADESSAALARDVRAILEGMPSLLDLPPDRFAGVEIVVDDRFVGGGYGVPTRESAAAIERCARTEGIFLDPTYTAKAMAGLIGTHHEFGDANTVLFWHTGGQVGLFA
jgi:1-aminocyclopropane-1-carboxylate deaminase/D-cysteine desulfhydrase-like pyridoxal-dependent ACC family enzyme